MSTTGIIYGKNFVMKVGAVQITNLVSNALSFKRSTADVTSKDSNDWKEIRPTVKETSSTFEGRFAFDAAEGYIQLQNAWDLGTKVQWRQGTGVTGDTYHTGYGYITDLGATAKYDDYMTFTGTLAATSTVTTATEP